MRKIAIVFAVMLMFSGISSAEKIQVVFATGEWLPYVSETLPDYGAVAALISAICEAGGLAPVYQFYPWKRAEQMVERGEVFAAFPYAISEERTLTYDVSEPLFFGVSSFMYFVKNPRTEKLVPFEELADLRGYRIGGIRGSHWEPVFENEGIEYEVTTTLEQSINKLLLGRIDFCIDDHVVLYDAVHRLYPDDVASFQTLPKPYGEKIANALLVSRTYPNAQNLLKKFHEGFALIKQNGEYNRIIEQYHMINY